MRGNYGAKFKIGDVVKIKLPSGEATYDKITSINVKITDCDKFVSYGMDIYHAANVEEDDILEGPDHCRKPRRSIQVED